MFHNCKNDTEKKKLYRRLSKHLHPDCGGESDLMTLLTESFEMSVGLVSFQHKKNSFYDDLKNAYEKRYGHEKESRDEDEGWDGVFAHVEGKVSKSSKRIQILYHILNWAKEAKDFKADFVKSIESWLESNGFITQKQYNCLVDLFYSRKIDQWIKNYQPKK